MPKHFMVCISGYSGVGKDECASVLLKKFGAVQTGLADPAKRHMADVYGFSYDQLFGPSRFRNAGDIRYPKNVAKDLGLHPCTDDVHAKPPFEELCGKRLWEFSVEGRKSFSGELAEILPKLPSVSDEAGTRFFVEQGDPRFWLSPRESLQKYCELMNSFYLDTWVEKGINVHRQLGEIRKMNENRMQMACRYERMLGVVQNNAAEGEGWVDRREAFVTCFADFRHWHEVRAAKRVHDMVPVLMRIRSHRVPNPPYDHRSETEQATIPDSEFHFVLENDGTVEEAHAKVEHVMQYVLREGAPSDTVVL
jgi:hypothetical protein